MSEPRRGPIPMRASWALGAILVVAVLCFAAGSGWGIIVGEARVREAPTQRCWIDTTRVAIQGEVYQVRYLDDDGFPRAVLCDGAEARDRVEAWVRR